MKILNHRLCEDDGTACPFVASPNMGDKVEHKYLVIHYTAGRSAESSIAWFTNPQARASAYLVVGRNGSVTQQIPFNRIAWHAGKSRWQEDQRLNRLSLGIELDNAGRLERVGDRWRAWFGREYESSEVIEAVHKHQTEASGCHLYTPEQIEAAVETASLLSSKYNLREVLGHDDISPGRKSDPGPAFPISSFRAKVLGRAEDEEDVYETSANLNIRTGPGTQHAKLEGSPLPKGTHVVVQREQGHWRFVEVLDTVDDTMDMEGWVHGRFLRIAS